MEQGSYYVDNFAEITKLLSIPPDERSKVDILELVYLLASNKFLANFKETGQLEKLCKHITIEFYLHNDNIFK